MGRWRKRAVAAAGALDLEEAMDGVGEDDEGGAGRRSGGVSGGSGVTVGQVALAVEDVERATAFYRDVVGLPFLFAAPPGLAFFDGGGVRIMLSRPEGDGASGPPGSILYYRVGDVAAAHERLTGGGAACVGEPHVVHRTDAMELWMGFYRDTEGNTFAAMEERTA